MAQRLNGSAQSKGKKGRKLDRNKEYCTQYKALGLQLKHKIKRMKHHIHYHPNDTQTLSLYNKLT